jgi:endonuclease-3
VSPRTRPSAAKSAAPVEQAVPAKSAVPAQPKSKSKPKPKPKPASRRRKPGPEQAARVWARRLDARRPGLVDFVLGRLAEANGRPEWAPRLDPVSELILTILSANSADTNAEVAFESLRNAYPSTPPLTHASAEPRELPGWGGRGLPDLPAPDWSAVEAAPLAELTDVIRPGGMANQKAPRIPAALSALRAGGDYSLQFLAAKPPTEARDWLAAIPGIGKKTASVVLLFSFGTPLMPVDRHVLRVSQRIGLVPPKADPDEAHEIYQAMLAPERMYEAHVSLITHGRRTCHAQRPDCEHCPLAPRCRYFDPKAE